MLPKTARLQLLISYLWILPAIDCLLFIFVRSSPVPYWDEYAIGQFIIQSHDTGHPTWSSLIAQHNESRKFFPRLLFWGMSFTGVWDPRHAMVAHWFILVATALAFTRLARRALSPWYAAWCSALGGALLLSISQWQNLLWGIQVITVVPAAALLGSLWILNGRRFSFVLGSISAGVLALIATYSYANGMVVWPMVILAILCVREVSWAKKGISVAAVSIAAVVSVGFYFRDYHHPQGHPASDIAYHAPTEAFKFVLAFIGNGLRFSTDIDVAMFLGWIALAGFCVCLGALAVICIRRRTMTPLYKALPWILLISYGFISAMTTAVGRLGFGVEYALQSRYVTFGIPIWAGLLPLICVCVEEMQTLPKVIESHILAFMGGILAALMLLAIPVALRESNQFSQDRSGALTLARWSAVAPNGPEIVSRLYPDPNFARDIVDRLNRLKLLSFSLNTKTLAEDYAPSVAVGSGVTVGSFDSLVEQGSKIKVAGWATLPNKRGHSADGVVIAILQPDGKSRLVIATTNTHEPRLDVRQALGAQYSATLGWSCELDRPAELRAGIEGSTVLVAFAYEGKSNTLWRIPAGYVKK